MMPYKEIQRGKWHDSAHFCLHHFSGVGDGSTCTLRRCGCFQDEIETPMSGWVTDSSMGQKQWSRRCVYRRIGGVQHIYICAQYTLSTLCFSSGALFIDSSATATHHYVLFYVNLALKHLSK
eukprot:756081-Ditylum_brightwellii.AAC.1